MGLHYKFAKDYLHLHVHVCAYQCRVGTLSKVFAVSMVGALLQDYGLYSTVGSQ